MKNIFDKEVTQEVLRRIDTLIPESKPLWGKMNVSQMYAHCNVTYEMVYEDKHPKPNFVLKFILKTFVKSKVVGEVPYDKNGQTAPQFIMKESKCFEQEKKRLVEYILKTQELGADAFDGKESHSFGALTKAEWNVMFYKHLDHHLTQFGA